MTCTICGKATGPGAMLCRPCKSALKRARHATVQDFPGTPPMVTMPAGLFPPPQARAGPSASRRIDANRETAQRLVLALLALALLAAAAYVGRRGMETDDAAPAVPPAAPQKAVSASPAAATITESPPRAGTPEPAPVVRASHSARTASARSTAASRAPPPASVPALPPPNETMAAVAEVPPAVPVARAPPPPDRWQMMADALARCANEGGLSGFICGQRVRIESCDGYWGRVAQCANRPDAPP
ncbi:MAG: hypothetical protein U1F15_07610 [Burkholderiales bacterium]